MSTIIEFKEHCDTFSDQTVQSNCRTSIDACAKGANAETQKSCFIEVVGCAFRPMTDYQRARCFSEVPVHNPPPIPAPPIPAPPVSPAPSSPAPPVQPPVQPPAPTPPLLAPVPVPSSAWQPDGRMKFATSFGKTGFEIEIGTHEIKKRPGFFYEGKGNSYFPELKINYTATNLGGGRYKMSYEIRRHDGWLVGKSDGFEFTAANGRINEQLEFGIALGEEGNFEWISTAWIYGYRNGSYEQM